MNITNVSACGLNKPQVLVIGRQLEDNYRQFVFDCSDFGVEVTSITLVHQRKNDIAPYIVASSGDSNSLTWNVSNTDTAYSGQGKAELRVEFANGLAKSVTYTTLVIESITGDTAIPEPLQSWYDAMIAYIDEHSVSPEEIEQAVADYLEEHPITAPVTSVNSKIGDVVLTASDVGALPSGTVIPSKTSDLVNDSGYISSYTETDPVFTASPAHDITAQDISVWNAKSDFSGNYNDLTNKPTIPSKTSQLQNDSGFLTSAPVTSVNGQTGDVVLSASDVHALPDSTVIPTVPTNVSAFQNDAGYLTAIPSEYVTDTELNTALAPKANTADLATVATSGDYDDLSNKPTIPTVPTNVSAFTNDANYITASQAPVQSVNGQTGAVTTPNTTYTISISGNVITLTPSTGTEQTINLPADAVSSVDGKTGAVTVIPTGGSTGQVLAKASATDRDVEWITPSGGGGSEWKQVVQLQTTEDLTSIIITEDDDGNALSFDEAYVIIMTSRASDASANGNFSISLVDEWHTSFNGYGLYNHGLFSDVYKFVFHITHDGVLATITLTEKSRVANTLSALTYWASEITWSGNNRIGVNGNSAVMVSSTRVITDLLDTAGKICAVTFGVDTVNAVKFGTGTRVEMWCK